MDDSIQIHQPCPDCGSSDALAIYETNTYCFSCKQWKPLNEDKETMAVAQNTIHKPRKFNDLKFSAIQDRHVELETCRKYGVQIGTDSNGKDIHRYPYYSKDGENVVNKIRVVDDKKFYSEVEAGVDTTLFGQQLFKEG